MATDLNHVVLVGRLTAGVDENRRNGQPRFAYVGNGQAKADLSIAVNRSRKNGDQWIEEANFFDVTVWGKTAENLKPYLTKGKQIAVDGYLKQDRWEKDGQPFSKISIIANNVQLLGGRSDGGQQTGGTFGGFQPKPEAHQQSSIQQGYGSGGFTDSGSDFPEDIPF
jgi:single stranded DNA-binding protein (ssb)